MKPKHVLCLAAGILLLVASLADAENWPQFRGANGAATSPSRVPLTWSDTANLKWKTALPGRGSSSPIVWGQRVYATSYAGYGDGSSGRETSALARHVTCVNRTNGEIVWSKSIPAEQPEDAYQGFISEHGYASNTPVTDGERLYVFLGKSGVRAFDLDGNELWRADVGHESSSRRWGSGSSLTLYHDLVIVNASEESQSVRALEKSTGREVWKAQASTLDQSYNTPTLVTLESGRHELVLSVPGEIWGLNADTGKLAWYAETEIGGNVSPSIIAADGIVYAFGGIRPAGSVALRLGGRGDVTQSHRVWESRTSSYVATPVLHGGHFYWVDDRGQAFCTSAKTGELVYQKRLNDLSGGRPVYASPVLANDRIYVVTRWDGTIVLPARPDFEVLAQNRFGSDDSDFNATPAISDSRLFLRSNRFLYCVGE